MNVYDYMEKINKICTDFEDKSGCKNCPLQKYACGLPKEQADIHLVVEIVEKYEEKTYPFGRCSSCQKEFNSELVNEYGITNCPWCGQKIDG